MRTKLIVVSLLLASCRNISMPNLDMPKPTLLTPYKIEIRQGNMVTSEMREKLKVGMSRLQVRAVLGTPLVNDPFHASRWDYVYRLEQDGKIIEQQRLTLHFDDDRLARIDESSMPVQNAPPQEAPAAQPKIPVPAEPGAKK